MSRSHKLVVNTNGISVEGWKYPQLRKFCSGCGHRHCGDPNVPYTSNKSMAKSKVPGAPKRHLKMDYEE